MNPGFVLDGTVLEARNIPRIRAKLGIADGGGLPAGGTTGQSLTKTSNADFDVDWTTISGGGAGLTNLDGGHSNTVYGGTTGVDGGGA
jgi:hypothetical protein